MATTAATRFDICDVRLAVAGPQPFDLDAHITTRGTGRGRAVQDVLTVSLGSLIVYCHDLSAVEAFATVWRRVDNLAAAFLPETAQGTVGADRHHVGVVLRVAGTPTRWAYNVIPAGVDLAGIAHARVQIGRLTVHALDLAAIRSWTHAWRQALSTAARIWPAPDAFAAAERHERTRIARTGTVAAPRRGRVVLTG